MTIKYSPDFTGEYYLKLQPGECQLEQAVLDGVGLLESFELHLGLPSQGESGQIRTIEYRQALAANKANAFYEQSFDLDSFGVAATLLTWRDTLLMQGWNPDAGTGQERLDKLSEVERTFRKQSNCPGTPDRWGTVIKEMEGGRTPFLKKDKIEVWYPKDLLPVLIQTALSLSGADVKYNRETLSKQVDFAGKKVELRRYTELTDAFEAFALETQPEGTVFINEDNYRFNAVLRRYGLALEQASTEEGSPSIPQIFKLGLLLLVRPMDPQTLLSYLQLPAGPLPGKLASALSRALLDDNGVGEKWDAALNAHPEGRERAETFLLALMGNRSDPSIPTDLAKTWCKAVIQWTEARLRDDKHPVQPVDIPQFSALASSCRGMLRLLDYEGATMDQTKFSNIVKSLYDSVSIRTDDAEVFSFDTVSSPAAILSTPRRLVWLNCNGVLDASWPFAFLTSREVEALEGMGVKVPAKDLYFRYGFSLVTDLLSRVDDIILVRSEYDCGEALREHPAVTLALQAEIPEKVCSSPEYAGPLHPIVSRESFLMGQDVLGKFKRRESVSSIEELIDNPADYYLEYVLKLKDIKDLALADIIPARGLVAHLAFENLMKDGNKDVKQMLHLVNAKDFPERVRVAAACKGANLLLGENEVDFEGFVVTLRDSFNVLLGILESSGLEPCETEFSLVDKNDKGANLGGAIGEVAGFVDLVAKKKGENNYVVIDLKYPKGSGSYYIDKLRKDESIQLEIYSLALAKLGKPVVATAYYLMPLKELHTCYAGTIFLGKGVIPEKKKSVTPDLKTRINDRIGDSRAYFQAGDIPLKEPNNFAFGRQLDTFEILKDEIK